MDGGNKKEPAKQKSRNQATSKTIDVKKRSISKDRVKEKEREREARAVRSGEEKKGNFLQNETLQQINKMAAEDGQLATDQTKFLEKPQRADPRFRWAERILSIKVHKINREFIEAKKYKPEKVTHVFYENNGDKNRYDDIICIDGTRVVLKERQDDDNYIHANWMTMPDGQRYISTQGPVNYTIEDFWHMVYTEKSNVVVMLTSLVDDRDGKESKCARYYPLSCSEPSNHGIYKISQKSQEKDPFPGIFWFILVVERTDGTGTGPFTVNHFIYDTWTDHTAPETAVSAVGLFKLSKKLSASLPITVHCSAGIGRTATFVGIDYASQKIATMGERFQMVDVVRDLRNMRIHAIQSAVQYLFLHVCVLELFAQDDVFPKNVKYYNFLKNYQQLLKRFVERNKNHLGPKVTSVSKAEPKEKAEPKSGDSLPPQKMQ